jgi:hypothetical protein
MSGALQLSALQVIEQIQLAGRPVELPAAEQVQMNVKNGLARAAASIEDRTISIQQIAVAGELRRGKVQFSDYRLILGSCLIH